MIDYQTLRNWRFEDVRHTYTADDMIRYALALGVGDDPTDPHQLQFVSECGPMPLVAIPSVAVVLGFPGSWMNDPATGIDFPRIVHGEELVLLHRTIPIAGTVVAKHEVVRVVDKGPGRGALITYDKSLFDEADGSLLATVRHTTFARGDGGFASDARGSDSPPPAPHPVPTGRPERTWEYRTLPQQALLYRLLADRNPLHASPQVASAAGFARPILHGLGSFGIACRAILSTWCAHDPARLADLSARFSAPVLPGDTLRFEMYADDDGIAFRACVAETGKIALDFGRATLR